MPRLVHGSGTRTSPRLFVCGERPGWEEYRAREGFVGPSGDELWSRLSRCANVHRDACWVDNLVKSFSTAPPTPREIARDAPILRATLRAIRPRLIVAVGAHAARWFLPQFRGVTQDFFHGLAFSTPRCPGAIVIPVVHSAAALRQPDLYQHTFTEDCRAVGTILRRLDRGRPVPLHLSRRVVPVHVGLAGCDRAPVLGLDTEGYRGAPECITVSATGLEGALLDVGVHKLDAFRGILGRARRIAIHHAKHDWQILAELHLELPATRVDCTMLEAYELGLPQSLKVLAFRLFGYRMIEYDDLVGPLDNSVVVHALEAAYATFKIAHDEDSAYARASRIVARTRTKRAGARTRGRRYRETQAEKNARRTYWRLGGSLRDAQGSTPREDGGAPRQAGSRVDGAQGSASDGRQAHARGEGDAQGGEAGGDRLIPKRGLSSLRTIIDTTADASRRARWLSSKFSPHVPLPPAPTWKDAPHDDRVAYALTDAIAHRDVHLALTPRIAALGLDTIYRIDRGVLPFLVRNESVGLAVDEKEVARLDRLFAGEYAEVCAKINRLAGREVNPLAAEDISTTIFDDWGVTPTRQTATGFFTTQDKYLKARKHQHEGVPLVIEARQINKYRGTYVSKLPSLLRGGRYHPNWKYTRTSSGRPAEEIILLIPKHDPEAKRAGRLNRAEAIRNCFYATDGHALVSCDLSQIEMRMMAHESRDKLFLYAYTHGIDMHAQTAHQLLGAPKAKADQDDSAHRLPAKTLNFGVLMGMTEYGLVDQLREQGRHEWYVDLDEEAEKRMATEYREAGRNPNDEGWERWAGIVAAAKVELRRQGFKSTREFLTEWFKVYPGVRAWCDLKMREAERTGYVRDFRGRRIPVDGVWSTNPKIAAEFRRKAHAIPIQSGAISIAKRWIARVYRDVIAPRLATRTYCEPWVWVHDDITLETDVRVRRTIAREVLACVPQDLCVPVTADAKSGYRWGSLH